MKPVNRLTHVALATATLLVAGCAQSNGEADAPSDPARENGSTVTEGQDSEPSNGVPVCLAGEAVADGAVEVRDGGSGDAAGTDAERLAALRWERHEGCERLVLDLTGPNGAAAEGAGAVTAEVLRDLGVVRVALRDVERVEPEAADTTLDGPLGTAVYAVSSPEGSWVYVDVHLGAAAEASVATLEDPARVVVDLRPGGGSVPESAPAEDRVVVLEPRPGQATYPLTVTGYARTFEANVVVRLEQDGEEVYDDFTTATAWADAWGHYSFTIPDGPSGSVVLHVGEHSARDGTWEGVAVPLDMR